MNRAENAIEVYNSSLEVHSSNIANMSVPGFKAMDVDFQSIFERLISAGSSASSQSDQAGTNPFQLGQGVAISNVSIDFSQGALVAGNTIDLAINGTGLFVVSDDGGATYRYTRAGQFGISGGKLVTSAGMQVYGLNSAGNLTAITGLAGSSTNYSWSSGGDLLYNGSATGYRIALTYFENPSGLEQAGGTTFKESLASGLAAAPIASGGAAGTISAGQVEQSNVFYLGETIDTLEMQRAMSANLSIVRMASDMISSFISRLG